MKLVRICTFVLFFGYTTCHLVEFYRWKQLSFEDIGHSWKRYRHSIENVVPYNNVPMGVTHFRGKFIVSVPRRKPGIPSTLNYVSSKFSKGSSPQLRSFPDKMTNRLHPRLKPKSNKIISVYRTRMDECDRLWFVDTGALQYNNTIQVQNPSIWIVNMTTEKVIRRFEISEEIVKRGHGLISLIVDVKKGCCNEAFAYLPDLLNHQIHVYSFQKNKIWTFKHDFLVFEQSHANFDVDGFQYEWKDGVFSITLGKRNTDGYRMAYLHPMASVSEYAVNTKILQTEESSRREDHGSDFIKLGERGANSQSAMHDFDQQSGVILFSQIGKNGLSCWNTEMPLNPTNAPLVAQDHEHLVYPADLNIDKDGTLWLLTNKLPRFVYGNLNSTDYNFRIWTGKVKDLIKGSACDSVA